MKTSEFIRNATRDLWSGESEDERGSEAICFALAEYRERFNDKKHDRPYTAAQHAIKELLDTLRPNLPLVYLSNYIWTLFPEYRNEEVQMTRLLVMLDLADQFEAKGD